MLRLIAALRPRPARRSAGEAVHGAPPANRACDRRAAPRIFLKSLFTHDRPTLLGNVFVPRAMGKGVRLTVNADAAPDGAHKTFCSQENEKQ